MVSEALVTNAILGVVFCAAILICDVVISSVVDWKIIRGGPACWFSLVCGFLGKHLAVGSLVLSLFFVFKFMLTSHWSPTLLFVHQIMEKVALEVAYVMLTCRGVSICRHPSISWLLGMTHLAHLAVLIATMTLTRESALFHTNASDGTITIAANFGWAELGLVCFEFVYNVVIAISIAWGLVNRRRSYIAEEMAVNGRDEVRPSIGQFLEMLYDEGMQYCMLLVLAPVPLLVVQFVRVNEPGVLRFVFSEVMFFTTTICASHNFTLTVSRAECCPVTNYCAIYNTYLEWIPSSPPLDKPASTTAVELHQVALASTGPSSNGMTPSGACPHAPVASIRI